LQAAQNITRSFFAQNFVRFFSCLISKNMIDLICDGRKDFKNSGINSGTGK